MQMDNQLDQQRLQMDATNRQENIQLGRERIQSQEDIAQMRARIALQRQQQNQFNRGG